ncbi:MAG: amino acid permease [Caldilineaceae bacterium]
MDQLSKWWRAWRPARASQATTGARLFNTFDGVFLPTLLTILGAVMYLRTGWIVGNAGLLGAWSIITLANVITFCTGLSISTVATNIRVGAGGSFSIISQSLGLEVGGSVNLPFYLAQSISVAFYIFAFTEGWRSIFPTHPELLILLLAFGVCYGIAYISVGLAARIRYPILFIVSFSLFSAFLGSFAIFGQQGAVYTPELIGRFPSGSYWQIFAVFFPAVTGVLAGVNLSGTLAEPRRSIPIGTMSAIVVTFVVYMLLAYWSSVVATPAELVSNFTIMVDRAAFGWAVQIGILAATFSAALNSLVGAPRILQAMAQHDVVPFSKTLAAQTAKGEPRPAMLLTGAIAVATLLFGLSGNGLNRIAPLMTMFFLVTYAVLNGVVLLEQLMGLTSFRPILRVPRLVPLIGLAGALAVMFLIAPLFSLVAVVTILVLYQALQLRQLNAPWSDVRSGMFTTLAEWAAKRTLSMPQGHDRAWKPSLLVPVESNLALRRSYRFLSAIAKPNGSVHIMGGYRQGRRELVTGLPAMRGNLRKRGHLRPGGAGGDPPLSSRCRPPWRSIAAHSSGPTFCCWRSTGRATMKSVSSTSSVRRKTRSASSSTSTTRPRPWDAGRSSTCGSGSRAPIGRWACIRPTWIWPCCWPINWIATGTPPRST